MALTNKTRLKCRVDNWIDRVLTGEIISCHYIVKAAERWKRDLKRTDIYFDEAAFELAVGFSALLTHFKGAKAGQKIVLEDWELFIFANLFGWKIRQTGLRRFTYGDVLVPRKNGKTTLAAIVALYMLLLDGEPGAEVYAAAVDKEQAKICFETAKELVRRSPFEEQVQIYRGAIACMQEASTFKPMTKDTKNKDGLNPHCAVCDERHAWITNEIYEVIKTGMGSRLQPLMFSISTAGFDTSLPYFSDVQVLKDIMDGLKEKDNHFILLYIPDEGDKFDDPSTWKKVNPNLGVSLRMEYMENECAEAKLKGGSTLAAFCVKNLNMWVDAPSVWIADDDVTANYRQMSFDELLGQECYVGIDLARKTDIVAVSFFFPKLMTVLCRYVVPEAKVLQDSDRVDYRKWAEQGWLTVAPGNVLDEDWFMAWLITELDKYKVRLICYDPWGMWNMLGKFGRYQEYLTEYQQSIRYMSVPTKWLESSTLQHKLNFMGDPVLRWMFKNVVIYRDPNDNIKLDKARSRNKIDGVVATVNAIGGWLNKTAGKTGEIYTDHSLRIVSHGNW